MNLADKIYIHLEKAFATFQLQVELTLPGRGVSVLFGQSGSGKTSLLRCIAGLEKGEGRILVRGETWQDDRYFMPVHKRPLGYVFQEANLFAHLSVQSNLNFGLKRVGQADLKVALDQAVELLGIGHLLQRMPQRLSGGERQRVAIAQALAMKPRLLLMDEPLAALDTARKQEILPYLQRLHDELDIPVLYVTHSIDELSRLADHLVVLEQGKAVASGPLSQVLADLDLPVKLGEETGVVLVARISERDTRYNLARADFPGGGLWARDMGFAIGDNIRLRVLARDVSLALDAPENSSILNALPAVVDDLGDSEHPGVKMVRVMVGDSPIISRLSHRSVDALALEVGKPVWVQIKSVAVIE